MNSNAPFSLHPNVFRPDGVIMLCDVRAAAEAELEGLKLRDVRSAFNVLTARLGIDPSSFPASAPALRRLFADNGPEALGVSRTATPTSARSSSASSSASACAPKGSRSASS